jgi:UDP-N-acetylmuramate dehydrogenase
MQIKEGVSLAELTTFKVGGPARYFCSVENLVELREALGFAYANRLPWFVLGRGSNVLASDLGFAGLIIQIKLRGVEYDSISDETDEVLVIVAAGEEWDPFVFNTLKRGFGGLENLSGIPGTVGATPIQNVGAYGVEVKDFIEWVEALDVRTGDLVRLPNELCQFEYRGSFFKTAAGKNFIVTSAAFRLKRNTAPNLSYKDIANFFDGKTKPTLLEVRQAVLSIRAKKFPDIRKIGTAGSFFKNPIVSQEKFNELKKKFPDLPGFELPATSRRPPAVKIPLAWILDKVCNLKGFKSGPVGLYEAQPLVLVNLGGGTQREVQALAEKVAAEVKKSTGIDIEWEVQLL